MLPTRKPRTSLCRSGPRPSPPGASTASRPSLCCNSRSAWSWGPAPRATRALASESHPADSITAISSQREPDGRKTSPRLKELYLKLGLCATRTVRLALEAPANRGQSIVAGCGQLRPRFSTPSLAAPRVVLLPTVGALPVLLVHGVGRADGPRNRGGGHALLRALLRCHATLPSNVVDACHGC